MIAEPGAPPNSHGLRDLSQWKIYSPVAVGELHSLVAALRPLRMTIDQDTGCIQLSETGPVISSSLSRSEFLAMNAYSGASVFVRNEPWCSYRLPDIQQAEADLRIVLFFHGQHLRWLNLSLGAVTSWDTWSEERELARKAFHEHWLTQEMHMHLGKYQWGEITSYYDPRGGSSGIAISYGKRND